jgi:hypothetical protein
LFQRGNDELRTVIAAKLVVPALARTNSVVFLLGAFQCRILVFLRCASTKTDRRDFYVLTILLKVTFFLSAPGVALLIILNLIKSILFLRFDNWIGSTVTNDNPDFVFLCLTFRYCYPVIFGQYLFCVPLSWLFRDRSLV